MKDDTRHDASSVIADGLITIHMGDCMERLANIPADSVDLIVTDPPYFLPIQSYVGKRGEGYANRTLADTSILKGYFKTVFEELERVLKPSGTFYVFCDGQSYPIFYEVMFPHCKYVRPIIWDKIVSYNGYTWRHQHEIIAWGERQDAERVPTGDGDIIKCRGVLQKDRHHPAEKPVELLIKLIGKHSQRPITVLDPYCGSGSTLVACRKLGVRAIGIELDEQYEKTIKKRVIGTIPITVSDKGGEV